jgi:hypothetical protein
MQPGQGVGGPSNPAVWPPAKLLETKSKVKTKATRANVLIIENVLQSVGVDYGFSMLRPQA